MRSERRRYIRFLAQDNAYAALGTHFSKVGKLKDISIAGLAFEYIENTEVSERDSSKVTIFLTENGVYLPDFACRIIYDHPIHLMKNKSIFKPLHITKRCAVQFMAITAYQRKKLENFLNHYTRGIAPSSIDMNLSQ